MFVVPLELSAVAASLGLVQVLNDANVRLIAGLRNQVDRVTERELLAVHCDGAIEGLATLVTLSQHGVGPRDCHARLSLFLLLGGG